MEKLRRKIPFILLCLHITLTAANDLTLDMDVEYYCFDRGENELFRRNLDNSTRREIRNNCPLFFRCTPAAIAGEQTISMTRCLQGLYFDVERQICDITREVKNCDQWDKTKPPRPFWPLREGETSRCEGDKIQCGSGECIVRDLFCDDSPDCQDGSDENICSPDEDPNGASRCDPSKCHESNGCFCSVDGTRIPGGLIPTETPQMILITFSGAVNERNVAIFDELFSSGIKNKGNGCTIKATFFVSHAYTNYSAVEELRRQGHEIAAYSISNNQDYKYWSDLSYEGYQSEFVGNREIIEKYSNITVGDILGLRVPQGRVGGNSQFSMMQNNDFYYDSSLSAPRGRLPIWPYDLKFKMPHKCLGTDQNCPSRNFTVYEMVLNELDRRDDPTNEEKLTGCYYVDQCANVKETDQFLNFLNHNLNHHYKTNRAPFGLHFTAAYFETRKPFLKVFKKWIRDISARSDHYFLTNLQAISWLQEPEPIQALSNYENWRGQCEVNGLPYCSLPNPCPLRAPRLFPYEENMFLYTCEECPRRYPWLDDPLGGGFRNDIF